jgi:hypothetical protein
MNPHFLDAIKAIATLAETPWKKRKSTALRRVIDQLVEISDCLAPLPNAPEDHEDFHENLQALALAVEALDATFDELQATDSPQETTSAVEQLDDQLSTVLELLSKLSKIGQFVETTEAELREKWLPRVREVASQPLGQRETSMGALLLAPLTGRESDVIRGLIREVIREGIKTTGQPTHI